MSLLSTVFYNSAKMVLVTILVTVVLVPLIFVLFLKWRYTYWTRRGLVQLRPDFLFGNTKGLITGKSSLAENFYDIYRNLKKQNLKHGGLYMVTTPSYMPINLQLVKEIMQMQYPYFDSHGIYNHKMDILSSHLFNIEGEPWRKLRQKLTPAFTSGKIKMMFETFVEKSSILKKVTNENLQRNNAIMIKDLMERFTIDIIGRCVFGIECNSLKNPDNEFKIYGTKVFKPRPIKNLIEAFLPWTILPYLGHRAMDKDVEDFFRNLVKTTRDFREENKIYRKDLLQMLIELKNKGTLSEDEMHDEVKINSFLSEEEVIAQCFLFFSAGYETSSSTSTFALYELAQNPQIQEHARKEIAESLKENGNKLTYEMVMDMKYLDKVVNETLRKYPPLAVLPRKCTKSRRIPGTQVVIEKGTLVWIPVWGIHRDPEYYCDPEKFEPERFSKENIAKRPDFTWLPFGEGPRLCIGKRFGILQTKMALICMLSNFKFSVSHLTPKPIKLERASFTLNVKGEIWLEVLKL